ncbi:hypothetical protein DL770_011114 [Monosporascus sp. CRB-9-2]|nr:hypothetical protein DL770_011114 [Monosporascus sp. CRB-9-2]
MISHLKQHHQITTGNRRGYIALPRHERADLPYISGVRYQVLWNNKSSNGLVEVERGRTLNTANSGQPTPAAEVDSLPSAARRALTGFKTSVQRSTEYRPPAGYGDQRSSWLDFVGWEKHLEGIPASVLRALLSPQFPSSTDQFPFSSMSDAAVYEQRILDSFKRLCIIARFYSQDDVAGKTALLALRRHDINQDPRKPFQQVTANTWNK